MEYSKFQHANASLNLFAHAWLCPTSCSGWSLVKDGSFHHPRPGWNSCGKIHDKFQGKQMRKKMGTTLQTTCFFMWYHWKTLKYHSQHRYWLVVGPPLWKIWVRQLGWWSQPNSHGKIKFMATIHHQPEIAFFTSSKMVFLMNHVSSRMIEPLEPSEAKKKCGALPIGRIMPLDENHHGNFWQVLRQSDVSSWKILENQHL